MKFIKTNRIIRIMLCIKIDFVASTPTPLFVSICFMLESYDIIIGFKVNCTTSTGIDESQTGQNSADPLIRCVHVCVRVRVCVVSSMLRPCTRSNVLALNAIYCIITFRLNKQTNHRQYKKIQKVFERKMLN